MNILHGHKMVRLSPLTERPFDLRVPGEQRLRLSVVELIDPSFTN